MILDTINHVTIEGLGFQPIKLTGLYRAETYIRGGIMITFDQAGSVKAIVNGSMVPDINLDKLKLFLKRP